MTVPPRPTKSSISVFSGSSGETCVISTLCRRGLEAAFKTPSLRNVAMRPPYMHAGQFATLGEVVSHYAKSPAAVIGHSELAHGEGKHTERKPIKLSEKEIKDVAAFLGTLSGAVVEPAPR